MPPNAYAKEVTPVATDKSFFALCPQLVALGRQIACCLFDVGPKRISLK